MPWNLVVVDETTITAEQAGLQKPGCESKAVSACYNAAWKGGI
jgi:hypothetical protein